VGVDLGFSKVKKKARCLSRREKDVECYTRDDVTLQAVEEYCTGREVKDAKATSLG